MLSAKPLIPPRLIRDIQRFLFRRLGLHWTTAAGITLEVLSRTDWTLYNDIFVEGEYDRGINQLRHWLNRQERATIVDLGANVGFFCLRVFQILSTLSISPDRIRIIAVEPSPENIVELRRRIGSQGPWSGAVSIVPGIVGEQRQGTSTLWTSHNYHMNTLVNSMAYAGARPVQVNYVDLDRLIPPTDRIALLKCDIEGAELDLVRTYPALLQRVDAAIFEIHHNVCQVSELRAKLDDAGLECETVCTDRGNTSIRLYQRSSAAIDREG